MADTENSLAIVDDHQPAPIRQHAGPRLGLPTSAELQALEAYGNVVVKSGMAPKHIGTWQAAVVVMRYGHQLGIDEFTALQNLFIVGGKPAAMASLLHTLILRDHGNDAIRIVETTHTVCRLVCRRRGSAHTTDIGYTIEEAKQASLVQAGGNWTKYPADMLFARAVSRAGRLVFRDSTMGMYVPDEIGGSAIEVNGEVIDVEIRETPHRITGSTAPERATHRILASLTVRAAAANANQDQEAWKALIKEVGKDVVLWPALIAQSPSEMHLAWMEKAANGKGQQLFPHFDRRRAELASLVEARDVADYDNTADDDGADVDPATGERIPDWVGRAAERDQLAGMPTPMRGRPSDQIAGIN